MTDEAGNNSPKGSKEHAESGTSRADVENQTSTAAVSSILQRWRREDVVKKGNLVLRSSAFLFSFISFIVVASNRHGGWKNFDNYEEYRYLLAVTIFSSLYTIVQISCEIRPMSSGQDLISPRNRAYVDFMGDQILAYLLISAASAAVPLTNRMREGADNIFTDASAASISMAFFAFGALSVSALMSGFKLSRQTYI